MNLDDLAKQAILAEKNTFAAEMKSWTCVAPDIHWWLREQVLADRYMEPLSAIFEAVKPKKYLAIGVLYGTLESYMIRKTGHHPKVLVACDMDTDMYNKQRDNLSYAYRNITGASMGNYQGHLVMVRDSSHSLATKITLQALAPFDLIYVDGDHIEEGALQDIQLAYELLAVGGIALVHDLDLPEDDVRNAYNRFLGDHSEVEHCEIKEPDFKFGLGIIRKGAHEA